MQIHFAAPNFIEPWDYRNVFEVGIGGSETSQVEMALRLAKRGHDVTSYTRLPEDCPDREFGGVHWRYLTEMNLTDDGLWIIYRKPSLGKLCIPSDSRRYWLMCQDVFYPDWDSEATKSFDRIIGLCPRHIQHLAGVDPANSDRLCLSSNGVNVERIRKIESLDTLQPRYPKRIIWASSPDRGLKECLDIFERAQEQVADLELRIFYGMDNIDKICGGDRKKMPWRLSWQQYDRACNMPGVTWRGRVGQRELTKQWLLAGIWLYPTWFQESSCISCMEAQACGAIPITNPIWATGYNVRHGIFIEGEPSDSLVKSRYVEAVVCVAQNWEAQERLRVTMMPTARKAFDWELWVDQWECWMDQEYRDTRPLVNRMVFQRLHAKKFQGRVVNIGSGTDPAKLKRNCGAVNVDLHEVDQVTEFANEVDVLADARSLPFADDSFDLAVIGDVLEHMLDPDAIACLREARRVAHMVVITIPEDNRPAARKGAHLVEEYAPGIPAGHQRVISKEIIQDWLDQSGWKAVEWKRLEDGHFCRSWGVVAERELSVAQQPQELRHVGA